MEVGRRLFSFCLVRATAGGVYGTLRAPSVYGGGRGGLSVLELNAGRAVVLMIRSFHSTYQ